MLTFEEIDLITRPRNIKITKQGTGSGLAVFIDGTTEGKAYQNTNVYFMVQPDDDSIVELVTNQDGGATFPVRSPEQLYSFVQPAVDMEIIVTFTKK